MTIERRDRADSDLPAELSAPARRALLGAGYLRLEQLATVSENDIKRLHGMGPKGLDILRRALGAGGLAFAGGTRQQRAKEERA